MLIRDTTTVLSELMRIEDWFGGDKASRHLRTARHSRMLMCRSFSSGVQHPEAEKPREETPLHPERGASVQNSDA